MPDITTLFQGSDGATRENFNEKLSDVNAHGNNTIYHITAAERIAWNGKLNKFDGNILDFDTAFTHGMYSYNASTSNKPNGIASYGNLFVITDNGGTYNETIGWCNQIIYSLDNKILFRSRNNENPFSEWKNINDGGISANTDSVSGALTVSTAAPSSYIGDGKMWGVY